MTYERNNPPELDSYSTDYIDESMYTVCNSPAKVAVFVTAAREYPHSISATKIIETIDPIRKHPGSRSSVESYFTNNFIPGGHAQKITESLPAGRHSVANSFKITPDGLNLLVATGAVAEWELRHDEISLKDIFGKTLKPPGKTPSDRRQQIGPLTRLAILECIVKSGPRGQTIGALVNHSDRSAEYHAAQLTASGVLDRADKFDPANRRLIILPPGKPPRTSAKNYILFEIATNLLALGRTAITGDELLEEIKITAGVTDPMPIWRMVTGKQTQYIRLIDSEMFGSKTAHTNYTVHPYYKSAVEDLLGTITSLKTDPAARLKAFRFSLMLPTRPAVLTYLWGKAMRKTVAETAGLKRAADDALAGMQKYFKSVPSHREWYTKAACLGLDPEQFFTIKKEEAQGAKKICQMCEVRMQCLNYSITHHEDYGIWGGYSAEEREKLPLTVRQELNSINML